MITFLNYKKINKKELGAILKNFGNFLRNLTIVDYLLIFVILTFLAIAFLYFSRSKTLIYIHTINEFQDIREDPYPPLYWLSNSIEKGDEVFDAGGSKIAEVISVYNSEWGGQRRYSKLKIKVTNALYDKRTQQYRIGDTVLLVGNDISFNVGNTKYQGIITYVGQTPEPPDTQYRHVELTLKAPGIPPWLAESYDEAFVVKSSEGEEIFRVTSSEISPALNIINTADGRTVRSLDPYYKDVVIKAEALVLCDKGICYFNEFRPVKVGEYFWTQSEKSMIENARIMDVKELD